MAQERIVIVGAGIVGVCTAYYITRHKSFDPKVHEIVIIEAVRPACAASGKAGGLLSRSAFPRQIVPLSFQLHEDLAKEYNGAEKWGHKHLTTACLEASKKLPSIHVDTSCVTMPPDLDWIHSDMVSFIDILGGPETYAQVYPYKFTMTLLEKTLETGGAQLVIGRVDTVHGQGNQAVGVSYIDPKTNKSTRIDADHIFLTTGPWTSQLLKTCPVSPLKVHSILVKPTRQVSAYALFTELRLGRYDYASPEIYSRRDDVFVSGEGSDDPLPTTADKITVEEGQCDDLFMQASELSDEIKNGRVMVKQACYLPVVDLPSCSGPFIGRTNVKGLYVGIGHSCWGINNAPATGLLLAEILFDGKAHSANLRGLHPTDYFDALPILCND